MASETSNEITDTTVHGAVIQGRTVHVHVSTQSPWKSEVSGSVNHSRKPYEDQNSNWLREKRYGTYIEFERVANKLRLALGSMRYACTIHHRQPDYLKHTRTQVDSLFTQLADVESRIDLLDGPLTPATEFYTKSMGIHAELTQWRTGILRGKKPPPPPPDITEPLWDILLSFKKYASGKVNST